MSASRVAAWSVAALTVAAGVCAIALDLPSGDDGTAVLLIPVAVLALLVAAAVGLAIVLRRGSNPIGWLLLGNALVLALMGLAESWASYAVLDEPGALPGGAWAVLMSERGWPLLFVTGAAIAWLFPDGRLPSPRWRPYAIAAATSFAVLVVVSFLASERFEDPYADVQSPLPPVSESIIGIPFAISGLGALAGLVGGVAAVVVRFRRSTGVERLQLKWLVYAVAVLPLAIVACVAEIAITGDDGAVTFVALLAAVTLLPVAVGIAVLRYRLYEIDRLVNRTLVYVALTAGLVAVFAVVSIGIGVAVGSGSTVPTAVATLAVAVLFGPLRRRMQLLVDRRFDRSRYEGLRTVEAFLDRLRTGRAAPEEAGAMLAQALGDPTLQLVFSLPGEEAPVDAAGRTVPPSRLAERARTPVQRGGFALATVVHDPALGERPDLLDSVIAAAGLAIEIARLRVEVRRQLAEVEASRARIVTAGFDERRRLERDLHDGAQQRLVSIGLGLRHVQGQLEPGSRPAEALDATVQELSRAIEELRELARGVRPMGLDDGLARALRELAARSRLRVQVDATDERFEDRIETAAYFVASEALANAAKHAGASRVRVDAGRENGSLVLTVTDDGVGGAVPSDGSGLAGIGDRVAALGGSVSVSSPPGAGTVVTMRLPCAS